MGSFGRALFRLLPYAAWTVLLLPIQIFAVICWPRLARALPRWYHHTVCHLFGIEVRVLGEINDRRPTLFAANHVSYLDIMVLGSLIEGSFVAKAEVGKWPIFGLLAKLQRTVFVDRRAASVRTQRSMLLARLEAHDNLILFPEATSHDGMRVRPFKSALLSAAAIRTDRGALPVQPVSIAYTRLDGIPLGRALRPLVAWYGDMTIGGHMWSLLGLGRLTVEVRFHPPVTLDAFESRKQLTEYCFDKVSHGMAASNAGRAPDPVPAALEAPATDGTAT